MSFPSGKESTYVLLKGQKQIVKSLYLPEKNNNSFQFLLWVEIGDFLFKFER